MEYVEHLDRDVMVPGVPAQVGHAAQILRHPGVLLVDHAELIAANQRDRTDAVPIVSFRRSGEACGP